MKVVLEVDTNGKLLENDVLVFNGKKWCATNKATFLKDLYKSTKDLENEISLLKDELNERDKTFNKFKEDINKVLETYHDTLKILTKENE